MTTYGQDTVLRADTANGTLGNATDGQPWTHAYGDATTFQVLLHLLQLGSTPSIWDMYVLNTANNFTGEMEVSARFIVPDTSTCFGVNLRTSANGQQGYLVVFDAFQSPPGLTLYYRSIETFTPIGSVYGVTMTAGSTWWVKGNITGSTLSGRMWADGSSEPTGWQSTGTNTARTSGSFGITANCNGTLKVDSFLATDGATTTNTVFTITETNAISESLSAALQRNIIETQTVTESAIVNKSFSIVETNPVTESVNNDHTFFFTIIESNPISESVTLARVMSVSETQNIIESTLVNKNTSISEANTITESVSVIVGAETPTGDPDAQMLNDDLILEYNRIRLSSANASIQRIFIIRFPPPEVLSEHTIRGQLAVWLKGQDLSQSVYLNTINDVNAFLAEYP